MLTMVKQAQALHLQGVVFQAPEAADEAQLVVLNSLGEAISTTSKQGIEAGMVVLDLAKDLRDRAHDGFAYALVKGTRKGVVVWERRLGRLRL
jgi:hypothetical protein